MDEFIESFVEESKKLSRQWLIELLATKLSEAGVTADNAFVAGLADQLLDSGTGDRLLTGPAADVRLADITIEFTDEDIAALDRRIASVKAGIPQIVRDMSAQAAEQLFEDLKVRWVTEYAQQRAEDDGFRNRLETRWGEGLALLRMLLTVASEIGAQRVEADAKSRSRRDLTLKRVLVRLHARACQITAEIIVLLESGFADGAMARWRTLHEVSVVATLLVDGGNEVACRYVDHHHVEALRALRDFEKCGAQLGYEPISKAATRRVEKRCADVIQKHGPDFRHPYGWAAVYLGKKRPVWDDLQDKANRTVMQSHFRMASHTVHAGPHGIYFKLGSLADAAPIIAGASNAGLWEPAQNAALTLTQITALLVPRRSNTFFDIVALRAFLLIWEAIPPAFARADRQLREDDKAIRQANKPRKPIR